MQVRFLFDDHFDLSHDILAFTDPKEVYFYFMEDGWIYLANYHQRLCWVPVTCRGKFISYGKCIALGTRDGQVVIIDFSKVIKEPSGC